MFDVIGFWAGVTVITILLLWGPLIWALLLARVYIAQVMGLNSTNRYGEEGRKIKAVQDSLYHNIGNNIDVNVVILNKLNLRWELMVGGVLASIIACIALIIAAIKTGNPPQDVIAAVALMFTPVMSYVGVIAGGYLLALYAGKKVYKLTQVVNKLHEKLSEKES